jgi:hypothetical protein
MKEELLKSKFRLTCGKAGLLIAVLAGFAFLSFSRWQTAMYVVN